MRGSTAGATRTASSSSGSTRSEEHTSELQSPCNLVCRLLLEKKTITRIANATLYIVHDNVVVYHHHAVPVVVYLKFVGALLRNVEFAAPVCTEPASDPSVYGR